VHRCSHRLPHPTPPRTRCDKPDFAHDRRGQNLSDSSGFRVNTSSRSSRVRRSILIIWTFLRTSQTRPPTMPPTRRRCLFSDIHDIVYLRTNMSVVCSLPPRRTPRYLLAKLGPPANMMCHVLPPLYL
ncbi:unnamed protein product, partial [Ectocarpus sp. 13 AM-2016]